MMRRVLFVDDEPRVLDGLRRMLRPQRHEWDMTFALGGQTAIDHLDTTGVEVIVCDMRMPGVDGMTVLKHAKDNFPQVARIVLSGQTDASVATRSVPIAHQFLSKPCDAGVLKVVIERVCDLQALVNDPSVRRIVGQLGQLPVLPRVYSQLNEALEDSDTSLQAIVAIVEQDVALTARCLQFANSAFFGLPRRVTSLSQAVAYLGTSVLRDLVLSSEVFSSFRIGGRLTQAQLERIERHALMAANIARRLLDDKELGQQASLAAMLHDIGRLVLGSRAPDELVDGDDVDGMGGPSSGREGVTHAEVGAYLLGLWGLPHAIVEAVAHQDQPTRAKSDRFDVVGAVYVAILLAHEVDGGESCSDSPEVVSYLEAHGVADRLPAWQAMAAELITSGRG